MGDTWHQRDWTKWGKSGLVNSPLFGHFWCHLSPVRNWISTPSITGIEWCGRRWDWLIFCFLLSTFHGISGDQWKLSFSFYHEVNKTTGLILCQDLWVGKILWRRERLPTPVFWPREFHGLHSPWGLKESDMTERLSLHFILSLSIYIYIERESLSHFSRVWLCATP